MGGKTKKVDILDFLRASVTVNSKAYKKHVRAKRGTYTEIALPDALKANCDSQKIINRKAKIVFDKIKEMGLRFKDGKLWPRLLSVLRKNGSAANGSGYLGLVGFEVREDYPSSRLLDVALHFDNFQPYFELKLVGDDEIAIHLCVLEVDSAFEQAVHCYEWEFAIAGSGIFYFKGIEEFRVRGELGDGASVSGEGSVVGAGTAVIDVGSQIKEFAYEPEKKGRYVGIFSFNKVVDGELRTVLANQGMKLIGF